MKKIGVAFLIVTSSLLARDPFVPLDYVTSVKPADSYSQEPETSKVPAQELKVTGILNDGAEILAVIKLADKSNIVKKGDVVGNFAIQSLTQKKVVLERIKGEKGPSQISLKIGQSIYLN